MNHAASMGGFLSGFFDWWASGLSCLVPGWLRQLLAPSPDLVHVEHQGDHLLFTHVRPSTSRVASEFNLSLKAGIEGRTALKRWLTRQGPARRRILVRLEPALGLTTVVRLPIAAEPELHRLMPFEIDRRTPFAAERVYHGFRIRSRHAATQQMDVALTVIPRETVDTLLEDLKRIGVQASAVALRPEPPETEQAPVTVPTLPKIDRPRPSVLILNRSLALLSVILLVGAAWSPAISQKRQLAELEREMQAVKEASDRTQALRDQIEQATQEAGFLVQKKRDLAPTIVVLDEITRLLPDDTWLQRLEYSAGGLQIYGESATASALIGILEGSPILQQAEFRSPVVRVENSGRERFHVAATAGSPERP